MTAQPCRCQYPELDLIRDKPKTVGCKACGGWVCLTISSMDELEAAHRLFRRRELEQEASNISPRAPEIGGD
jgi:hypothetical protein